MEKRKAPLLCVKYRGSCKLAAIFTDEQTKRLYLLMSQQKGAFMRLFTVFFLLFFVSYGYSQSPESESISPEGEQSKKRLTQLKRQLEQYVDSLMFVLLDEDTPRKNQMEILDELRSIADMSGEVASAMDQISQSGLEQDHIDTGKAGLINENISVWAKNQAEIIRRKQSALNELQRRDEELDKDFYVNLALDGIVILAGGVLFFVPAVGPAISIPLTVGRITHISLTGQKLGALLMATGGLRSGWDIWNHFFEEEEGARVLSFVSSVALRDVLTKELFSILSSTNQSDRYVGINLLRRAKDEETLISDLLDVIKNERNSVGVRRPAIRAIRAFSSMDETLKGKAISVLKGVIDKSQLPSLRETSISVLGEIGEGELEVAEYLRETGESKNEDDKIRLMALTQLGRSKEYFPVSVVILTKWFEGINYIPTPLNVPLDIPAFFVDSLLSDKKRELSENQLKSHKTIVKEFIRLNILDIELKFSFSETLITWDGGLENRVFLRKVWAKPAKDIGLYVKQLAEESLSEENYQAFEFLRTQISILNKKALKPQKVLIYTESMMTKFDKDNPDQKEITEKLENFLNSYRKIQESLKN